MTDEELEAARIAQEAKDKAEADELAEKLAKAEKEEADKDKDKNKPSDAEAKLLKELMKQKAAAKEAAKKAEDLEAKYGSIDLDALLEAAKKAEEAETKELERKGDYDRLIAKQKEAHAKEMEDLKNSLKEAKELAKQAKIANEAAAAANAFANSRYVLDNLTLTPNKTKALYGDYFENEDGILVGYDKPKGSAGRTKLVDGAGDPVDFDEAMKQIIEADPDKETLIKANLGSGSGFEGSRGQYRKEEKQKPLSTMDKIIQGLKDQKLV